MSLVTNPHLLVFRRFARKLGLNRLLGALLNSQGYEAKLIAAIVSEIRPGDCVWDIGANVGFYTVKFARLVGESGKVYAFEPSPKNAERLRGAVENFPNVTVMQAALSDKSGRSRLKQGEDDLGATSRLVLDNDISMGTVHDIDILTGDSLRDDGTVAAPNILKIDVEGYEGEVLRGLRKTLAQKSLRNIFLEMHFRQLEELGKPGMPKEIEELLRANGFNLRWLDPSHLHALRS